MAGGSPLNKKSIFIIIILSLSGCIGTYSDRPLIVNDLHDIKNNFYRSYTQYSLDKDGYEKGNNFLFSYDSEKNFYVSNNGTINSPKYFYYSFHKIPYKSFLMVQICSSVNNVGEQACFLALGYLLNSKLFIWHVGKNGALRDSVNNKTYFAYKFVGESINRDMNNIQFDNRVDQKEILVRDVAEFEKIIFNFSKFVVKNNLCPNIILSFSK